MTATVPERRALCPSCQRLAISEVINHLRGGSILEATYLCPRNHQFQIRWLRPEPQQKEAS